MASASPATPLCVDLPMPDYHRGGRRSERSIHPGFEELGLRLVPALPALGAVTGPPRSGEGVPGAKTGLPQDSCRLQATHGSPGHDRRLAGLLHGIFEA